MTIDLPTMRQIVSNVFDEMLGLPTCDADLPPETFDECRVVASIRIAGATDQVVVVEAPQATAQHVGESMFAAETGSLESEEIRDAVGEIVNMIGGNVKGIYDGESTLSLPCVSEEYSASQRSYGSADGSERIVVKASGMPLLVHWHSMAPATT